MKQKPLLISLLISLGTGVIAGFLTFTSMEQYQEMYRPPLSPPGWVFPVVWLLLYALMGIAAYRIYMKDPKAEALKLYLIQLAINFLWPILFFNFGWQLFAAVWLLLLWYPLFINTTLRKYRLRILQQPVMWEGVNAARYSSIICSSHLWIFSIPTD